MKRMVSFCALGQGTADRLKCRPGMLYVTLRSASGLHDERMESGSGEMARSEGKRLCITAHGRECPHEKLSIEQRRMCLIASLSCSSVIPSFPLLPSLPRLRLGQRPRSYRDYVPEVSPGLVVTTYLRYSLLDDLVKVVSVYLERAQ